MLSRLKTVTFVKRKRDQSVKAMTCVLQCISVQEIKTLFIFVEVCRFSVSAIPANLRLVKSEST